MTESTNKLPMVNIQGNDGKWYSCQPLVAIVKGGKAVIYVDEEGTEIKREPLARYRAREARKATNTPTTDLNNKIQELIEEIVVELEERRGLSIAWNAVGTEVQDEIKESWFNIIKSKLTQ